MLSLLLLAPIFLLVTPNVAYAATPTISLSASSGPGAANTAGIKITGTDFPQLSSATGIKLYFISTSKSISVSGATSVSMYGQSLRLSSPPAGTVSVDGNGGFTAFFDSPSVPGDTYNVFVTYTPSGGSLTLSSAVQFTITPYLDVRLASDKATVAGGVALPTSRAAHFGQWVRVRVYSFGASESVSVTGMPVPSGASVALNTDASGNAKEATATNGYVFVHLIGETTGGSKTFTAVGSSTGLTATRSFTINPSIGIFAALGTSTISIPATAPATTNIALHGFANAEDITAGTVGGQTANFGAVTTSASGAYGAAVHLALLYTSSLSYGATSITITGSKTGTVTFNAANANVINPYAANQNLPSEVTLTAGTTPTQTGTIALTNVPILASTAQSSGTSIIGFNAASGFVGDTLYLYLTGWGNQVSFVTGPTTTSTVQYDGTGQAATCNNQFSATVGTTDANGAALCSIAVPASVRGSHTIKLGSISFGSSATNPGTTFSVKPSLFFLAYDNSDSTAGEAAFTNNGGSTGNVAYVAVRGDGYTSEALSLTVGTTTISASFTTPGTTGSFGGTIAAPTPTVIQSTGLPDLAAGSYKVVVQGATTGNNATGYDYYNYYSVGSVVTSLLVTPNFGLSSSLSVTSVSAGSAVVIQTTSTAGIHGLKPSSAYTVNLDGPSGTQLTTFTSTSGGAVPAGTQFVMPAATAGIHVIDFVQSGASVVIGQTVNVHEDLALDESTYANLYVTLSGTIAVTPSAGNVGATVGISGTGLTASTKYNVQLLSNGIAYASFTTTSGGAIPSGVSFVFPALGSTTETGTSQTIQLLNTATNVVDSTGTFLLQSGMSIAPSTAAPGTSVKATATGLVASTGYNIVWNAALNSNGLTTGTIVGAFTSGTDGSAGANFTVPASAAAGTYSVSLLRTTDTLGGSGVAFRLVSAASVTVSIGGQNLQGTSTFSASGAATQINLSGAPALQVTYTNNVVSAVTGIVYAVVHNAAGQTVYYTTATITPGAGATATAYLILAGLPSGTYSVTIFAVTPSGVAISATSTATATI